MAALNMIFLRLIQTMGDYLKKHSHVPYEQWLRRVTVNYIIDEFRKHKRYREYIRLVDEMPEDARTGYPETDVKYDTDEILLAIEKLPPMSKTVFNLYAVDGYKHEEIAGLLGISSGTSKAHLFKARQKLQEMLSDVNKKTGWNKSMIQ